MQTRPRFRFVRFLLPVFVLTGAFLFFGGKSAEANTLATCSHLDNRQFSTHSNAEVADCALSIAQNADLYQGYSLGTWGNYYLAINNEGDVYYNGGRRWSYWDTIDLSGTIAEPEPVIVDPNDSDGDGFANDVDSCVDEAETVNGVFDNDGCPDTIDDLLNFAVNDVNAYWEAEFAEANLTYREPRRVSAYRSNGRGSSAYNAFYSGGSHSIAYDMLLMERSLAQLGDAAPVFIIAHEFGHLVQANLGVLWNGRLTIQTELEADCLAGAYMGNANERGLLEEGDAEEAMTQAFYVGDNLPHEHEGAHGSPRQRAAAFELGFTNGADICFTSFNDL